LYNSDSFDILNFCPSEDKKPEPIVESQPEEVAEKENILPEEGEIEQDEEANNILEGKIELGEGLVLYGKIVNGLLDGLCKFEKDGVITSEIFFQNGVKNGECKFYNDGKILSIMTCQNGKREGIATYYNADGSILKTETYKDDKKNGPSITYYPTSEVMEECQFANDILTGDLYRYNKKGKVIEHIVND
jgi:antitoxin component YwqK of YwqJK toxin-antitoxin module